jgi:RecA-family ATPase
MKMTRWFSVVVPLLVLLAGCATVDYVGQSYESTTQVDIFYDEADIDRDYTVMGRAIAKGDDMVSSDKIQQELMKKAREKGADAIVIESFDRVYSGEHTEHSEDGTTTNTSVKEDRELSAIFIKYD